MENEEWLEPQAYIISEEEIPAEPVRRSGVMQSNFPIITCIIIVANVIAYIMCLGVDNYRYTGGLNYTYIVEGKEYGRLISYMFLHVNFSHLFGNMLALWINGALTEKKLGGFRIAVTYFVSGLVAGLVSMNMHYRHDPDTMSYSIGASGAVYGVMCAAIFLFVKKDGRPNRNQMVLAIVAVVVYAFYTYEENIDIYAHVAGAVTGGVVSFLLSIRKWEFFKENMFFRLLAVIMTVSLCIAGIGEADIGGTPAELPNERVDYIKEQRIYDNEAVTYGDGLNDYCTDVEWKGFRAENGQYVVQFTGDAVYKGRSVDVLIQFEVDDDCGSYELYYAGLNDEWLDSEAESDFLLAVVEHEEAAE